MKRMLLVILAAIALVYWAYFGEPARAQTRTAQQQLAVDVYKELVEINTVTATGDTARAAEAMAARLRAAGFHASAPAHTILPFRVLTPSLIRSASLLPGSEVRCRQSS